MNEAFLNLSFNFEYHKYIDLIYINKLIGVPLRMQRVPETRKFENHINSFVFP